MFHKLGVIWKVSFIALSSTSCRFYFIYFSRIYHIPHGLFSLFFFFLCAWFTFELASLPFSLILHTSVYNPSKLGPLSAVSIDTINSFTCWLQDPKASNQMWHFSRSVYPGYKHNNKIIAGVRHLVLFSFWSPRGLKIQEWFRFFVYFFTICRKLR